MAKAETVRLEAGTPLRGSVKFVDFYPEKENPKEPGKMMSAQWGFTGEWDNGESVQAGRVYVDTYQLDQNPVKQGLVKQDGKWPDGNPKFKWVGGPKPVMLMKQLKDKKAHVRIMADGGAAPALAGNGAPAGQQSVATPSPAPSPITQWWDEQYELMKYCGEMAKRIHGTPTVEGLIDAIVKTAHSFYIQANREGKLAPPATAENIRDTLDGYAGMPPQLKEGPPDPELPAWMQ